MEKVSEVTLNMWQDVLTSLLTTVENYFSTNKYPSYFLDEWQLLVALLQGFSLSTAEGLSEAFLARLISFLKHFGAIPNAVNAGTETSSAITIDLSDYCKTLLKILAGTSYKMLETNLHEAIHTLNLTQTIQTVNTEVVVDRLNNYMLILESAYHQNDQELMAKELIAIGELKLNQHNYVEAIQFLQLAEKVAKGNSLLLAKIHALTITITAPALIYQLVSHPTYNWLDNHIEQALTTKQTEALWQLSQTLMGQGQKELALIIYRRYLDQLIKTPTLLADNLLVEPFLARVNNSYNLQGEKLESVFQLFDYVEFRQQLKEIRSNYHKEIVNVSWQNLHSIQKAFTQAIQTFWVSCFEKIQAWHGPTPCRYALIELGSATRYERCPASDIEFAIVIEPLDKNSQKYAKAQVYFQSVMSYFKLIIALWGETEYKNYPSQITYELGEQFIQKGLGLDDGNSYPFARSPEHLFGDASVLLEEAYVLNGGQLADGVSAYAWSEALYASGDKTLVEKQREASNTEEKQADNISRVALEQLRHELLNQPYYTSQQDINDEINSIPLRVQLGNWLLIENKPDFNLFDSAQDPVVKIKSRLLRPIIWLVSALNLYHPVSGCSTTERLQALVKNNKLDPQLGSLLQHYVTLLLRLRFEVHMYYGKEDERVHFAKNADQQSDVYQLNKLTKAHLHGLRAGLLVPLFKTINQALVSNPKILADPILNVANLFQDYGNHFTKFAQQSAARLSAKQVPLNAQVLLEVMLAGLYAVTLQAGLPLPENNLLQTLTLIQQKLQWSLGFTAVFKAALEDLIENQENLLLAKLTYYQMLIVKPWFVQLAKSFMPSAFNPWQLYVQSLEKRLSLLKSDQQNEEERLLWLMLLAAEKAGETLTLQPATLTQLWWYAHALATQTISADQRTAETFLDVVLDDLGLNLAALLQLLNRCGLSPDAKHPVTSEYPIHAAAKHNQLTLVLMLIRLGAGRDPKVELNLVWKYLKPFQMQSLWQKVVRQAVSMLCQAQLRFGWQLAKEVLFQVNPFQVPKSYTIKSHQTNVFGVDTGKQYLTKEVIQQLYNFEGEFKPYDENNVYGRRHVGKIKLNGQAFYVKQYPECGPLEAAVSIFDQLVFSGNQVPYSEMFTFYDRHNNPYPVLISQGIQGINLQTLLNAFSDDPNVKAKAAKEGFTVKKVQDILKKIDQKSFSYQYLLALLLNEEDGKPDNRIVISLGEGTTLRYGLISVDNDHILIDPLILDKNGKTTLQLKSIIFCLDQMKEALAPEVIEAFLQHDPKTVLNEWLDNLINLEDRYLQLFPDYKLREIYLKKDSMVCIPIPPGTIPKLYEKWQRVREVLKADPQQSALSLLRTTLPLVGLLYEAAFQNNTLSSPWHRFNAVCGENYSKTLFGFQTKSTSTRLLLLQKGVNKSALLRQSHPEIQSNISTYELKFSCTPRMGKDELQFATLQSQVLDKIIQQVEQGNFDVPIKHNETLVSFTSLLLNSNKAQVIAKLNWQLITHEKQRKLLKLIKKDQVNFFELKLVNCVTFTDYDLEILLKVSPQLTILWLENTPAISDNMWRELSLYASNLTHLTLIRLPKLEVAQIQKTNRANRMSIILPQIVYMAIRNCEQLSLLNILAPRLTTCYWIHLSKLQSFTVSMSSLEQWLIEDCGQLNASLVYEQVRQAKRLSDITLNQMTQISYQDLIKFFYTQSHWNPLHLRRIMQGNELNLAQCSWENKSVWKNTLLNLPRDLEKLSVGLISDQDLATLNAYYPRLESLSVANVYGKVKVEHDLQGHTDEIQCIAILLDGKVVSGSKDSTLKVWDINRGKCIKTLKGHDYFIESIVVLPNGRVVSGSFDSTLRIWDTNNEYCLKVLQGHNLGIRCLAAFPDGRVISGSYDATLKIWDIEKGICIKTIEGHNDGISTVAILHDGRVVAGSDDKRLKVWDIEKGVCIRTIEGFKDNISSIAVLVDGRVVTSSHKDIKIWNIDKGKCLNTLKGHEFNVMSVSLLPSDQIISGSSNGEIKVWDTNQGICLATLRGHNNIILSQLSLPDGRIIYANNNSLKVLMWQVMILKPCWWRGVDTVYIQDLIVGWKGNPKCNFNDLYQWFGNLEILSEQTVKCTNLLQLQAFLMLLGTVIKPKLWYWKQPSIHYWLNMRWLKNFYQTVDELALPRLAFYYKQGNLLDLVPFGKGIYKHYKILLASIPLDVATLQVMPGISFNTKQLWQLLARCKSLKQLKIESTIFKKNIKQISLKDNLNSINLTVLTNSQIITKTYSELKIWDIDKGVCLHTLTDKYFEIINITNLTVISNGRVICASCDGTLQIWDIYKKVRLKAFSEGKLNITCLAVLSDKKVISGSCDGTLRVWDIDKGMCLKIMADYKLNITSLVVFSDDKIVIGTSEGELRLWDIDKHQCLRILSGHKLKITSLAIISDQKIVSGSDDASIKVWDIEKGVCIKTFEGYYKGSVSVAVFPDGRVITSSNDRTLEFWEQHDLKIRVWEQHVLLTPQRVLEPWRWRGLHAINVNGLSISWKGDICHNLKDLCEWFTGLEIIQNQAIKCATSKQLKDFLLILSTLSPKEWLWLEVEPVLDDPIWRKEFAENAGEQALPPLDRPLPKISSSPLKLVSNNNVALFKSSYSVVNQSLVLVSQQDRQRPLPVPFKKQLQKLKPKQVSFAAKQNLTLTNKMSMNETLAAKALPKIMNEAENLNTTPGLPKFFLAPKKITAVPVNLKHQLASNNNQITRPLPRTPNQVANSTVTPGALKVLAASKKTIAVSKLSLNASKKINIHNKPSFAGTKKQLIDKNVVGLIVNTTDEKLIGTEQLSVTNPISQYLPTKASEQSLSDNVQLNPRFNL